MENHDLNQRRKGDVRSCALPSFLLFYAPSGIYYAFAFLRRITHFSAYKQLVNSYRLREKLQKNFSGKNSFINRLYEDKYIYIGREGEINVSRDTYGTWIQIEIIGVQEGVLKGKKDRFVIFILYIYGEEKTLREIIDLDLICTFR